MDDDCVSHCPIGFFGDEIMRQCIACLQDCNFCTRSSCLACEPDTFLLGNGDACVPSCPAGTYTQVNSANLGACRACDESCRTCDGPGPEQCTDCFGQTALVFGRCETPQMTTPAAGGNAASGSSDNAASSTVVYVGVAVGAIAVFALVIIAIALLRKKETQTITPAKSFSDRSRFEISNPTYMMNVEKPKQSNEEDGKYGITKQYF